MQGMRNALLTALVALAIPVLVAAPKKAPQELPGGWVYAWGDEFNGTKLDTKKWAYELGVVRNRGSAHA